MSFPVGIILTSLMYVPCVPKSLQLWIEDLINQKLKFSRDSPVWLTEQVNTMYRHFSNFQKRNLKLSNQPAALISHKKFFKDFRGNCSHIKNIEAENKEFPAKTFPIACNYHFPVHFLFATEFWFSIFGENLKFSPKVLRKCL